MQALVKRQVYSIDINKPSIHTGTLIHFKLHDPRSNESTIRLDACFARYDIPGVTSEQCMLGKNGAARSIALGNEVRTVNI